MGLASCFRVLLFVENFIFWLIGVALIVIGAYILLDPELPAFLQILEGTQVICYGAIGVGVTLFVIGFFGCCGAFKKNPCLLKTYAILLIIIVLLEIAAAILIWKMEKKAISFLEIGWNSLDTNSKDTIQTQFACCGFLGSANQGSTNTTSMPTDSTANSCPNTTETPGCYEKLRQAIQDNLVIAASVVGSVAFLQLVSIVVSCALGREEKPTQVHPISGDQAWASGGFA